MALLNKIGHVLTADLSKEFSLKKKDVGPKTFIERLKKRRQVQNLGQKVHLSQNYVSHLITEAINSCPSYYSLQPLRIVILYNQSHHRFWQSVSATERKIIPAQVFAASELKLQQLQAGFGTILFFHDLNVIEKLKKRFPLEAEAITERFTQVLGMAQFAAWTALADARLGARLEHYPLAQKTHLEFGFNEQWLLQGELVFGSIQENLPQDKPLLATQEIQIQQ